MRTRDLTDDQILEVVNHLIDKDITSGYSKYNTGWVTNASLGMEILNRWPELANDVADMRVPGYARRMHPNSAIIKRMTPRFNKMAEAGLLVKAGGRGRNVVPFTTFKGEVKKYEHGGTPVYTTPERAAQYAEAKVAYDAAQGEAKDRWRNIVVRSGGHGIEVGKHVDGVVVSRDDFEAILAKLDRLDAIETDGPW